ncbi:MAG: aminomethyl-transferring glycine dehydrogenase subunit GcvPA [archaeon]|nr:aminomethyl-transferring glycine dehydrogenase subunit GcvPA [archaeon]
MAHKFLPNSETSITDAMLHKLGLSSVEELYSDVPKDVILNRPLNIPEALSEIELERLIADKLGQNKSYPEFLSFLGGGCWVRSVPSIVDEILSRGEFYTSYTPYQPEISQGMLQSMFEYQSQICELTGMEVANSSMYDWGTALGEAGRMAHRVTHRKRILVGGNTSPERVGILKTYSIPAGMDVEVINFDPESGTLDSRSLASRLNDEVAAVYIENPNFLGIIEEYAEDIIQKVHGCGALAIVGVDPSTLGLLKPPGSYGADIVVGDGQPLGVYPNFGGPLIGIFATKTDPALLRQMPGRLIGLTNERTDESRRGFVMVLQTREQHIRRENATSNICTNEALFALAVSIFLAVMGPRGMRELGEHMVSKSHYAQRRMKEEGFESPFFSGSYFGELSVKTRTDSVTVSKNLAAHRILGGLPFGRFYPDLRNVSLFSFNETHSEEDIDRLVTALKAVTA